MTDTRKPMRMGVTRKLTGLPTVKVQENALLDAGCLPVWAWAEVEGPIIGSIEGDVFVAVDQRVFKGLEHDVNTQVLEAGPKVKKKKPGPKPKLADATQTEWFCINWVYLNTKPKEANSVALAQALGFDVDRFAIRNRSNKEAREAEAARLNAIGNEGED